MPDHSHLFRYADQIKQRYLRHKQNVSTQLTELQQLWALRSGIAMPLASVQPELARFAPWQPYRVLGVDGSPFDLSRHRGLAVKAFSLAAVLTDYHIGKETVIADIRDLSDQDDLSSLAYPSLELEYGITVEQPADLLLLDGSLIRWQWYEWQEEKRLVAVKQYVDLLERCYQQQMPVIAVIDRSASRDILQVLEVESQKKFASFTDIDLFGAVLAEGEFSPVFQTHSPITKLDERYQIGYCYYRSGSGVLRIECLLGQPLQPQVWSMIIDQIEKGRGFPWSIARAHELCVIRERDRQLLETFLVDDSGLSRKEWWKEVNR